MTTDPWERPRPTGDGWRTFTIAACIAEGRKFNVNCGGCHRCVTMTAEDFAARTGAPLDVPVWEISCRLVCTVCGARRGIIHAVPTHTGGLR